MLLNRRGYRDALGDNKGYGVDGDSDGSASVLHARCNAAILKTGNSRRPGALHSQGLLCIAIHDLSAGLEDRCPGW